VGGRVGRKREASGEESEVEEGKIEGVNARRGRAVEAGWVS
jgi:hypothetical protein